MATSIGGDIILFKSNIKINHDKLEMNHVLNGDFEILSPPPAQGFVDWGGFAQASTISHTGQYAALIGNTNLIFQTIPFTMGQTYVYSIYISSIFGFSR